MLVTEIFELYAQKQMGVPAVLGHPSLHQPIGDSVAMAAATVMAGALGSAQTATTSNDIGVQNQSLLGNDPLTRHLAKMSRNQLTDVLSEMKAMASLNKEHARQLLLTFPSLPKALFQAQIMLGLVSPQMLQMPNIRQASAQVVQPLVQSAPTLPGLPPLPQNKMQLGVLPYAQESRMATVVSNQYSALQKFPTQPQNQFPQLTQNQVIQQSQLLAQSGILLHPSIHSQSLSGLSVDQLHASTSSSFNQQMQHPLSQNITPAPPTNSGHDERRLSKNVGAHASNLVYPQHSAAGFQFSSSTSSGIPEGMDLRGHTLSVPGQTNQMERASKMVKLNDGRANPSEHNVNIVNTPLAASFPTADGRQASRSGATINPDKQVTQAQVPLDVDSTLLEQVLNLTPEQLRSLPPDQQQQVIQLQQMLRQGT